MRNLSCLAGWCDDCPMVILQLPQPLAFPLLCTLFTKFNLYYLRSEPHKFAHSMNGWVGELETNHRSCHPLQASCNGPFLLMPRCMLKWLNKWPNLQFGDEMTEVGEEEKEKQQEWWSVYSSSCFYLLIPRSLNRGWWWMVMKRRSGRKQPL